MFVLFIIMKIMAVIGCILTILLCIALLIAGPNVNMNDSIFDIIFKKRKNKTKEK